MIFKKTNQNGIAFIGIILHEKNEKILRFTHRVVEDTKCHKRR